MSAAFLDDPSNAYMTNEQCCHFGSLQHPFYLSNLILYLKKNTFLISLLQLVLRKRKKLGALTLSCEVINR